MNKTVRVLVAEDDDDHRFLTMRALERFSEVPLEVEGVRDGQETIDFVRGRGAFAGRPKPDLVVLDLKMPRKDGFEVLEDLKGDPETSSIPVVVLSSSDAGGDVDRAYRRGTNAYMRKPTSASGFRAHLECLATYWAGRAELPTA
jgi:two-component system, chemotaxis family, response regulator Rcp1